MQATDWQARLHQRSRDARRLADGTDASSPTDDKVALINELSQAAAYAKIEVTSFTSPKAIPALRDGGDSDAANRAQAGRGLHRAGAQRARRASARSAATRRRVQPRHVGQRNATTCRTCE